MFDELGYPIFIRSVGPVRTEKVYRVGLTNKQAERGSLLLTEDQRLCTWNRDAMEGLTKITGLKSVPVDWADHEGKTHTLREVKDTLETIRPSNGSHKLLHVIPTTFPLVLPHRDVVIPPYIMGLTLQIHDPRSGLMTCKESMWDWYEAQFRAAGLHVTRTKKRLKRWRPTDDVVFSSAELNRQLDRMNGYRIGLVSDAYLRGSAQQRMDLLAGMLDISFDDINTHGDTNSMTNKQSSVMVWCGKNEALSKQVVELIRSLGYAAVASHHRYANTYTVSYTPVDNPYRYPKFRAQLPDLTRLKRNTFQRFSWRVQSIEIEAEAEVRSFEVTSPSGLVSVGDLFLPLVAGGF